VVVLGGFGWLLEMCLAQVVFHKDVITNWQANHIAPLSCRLYADPRLMQAVMGEQRTVIRYPWDNYQELSFTGVPPHGVAILHEIRHTSKVQKDMINNLMKHLDGRLDGLVDFGNGGMSVTCLTNLFNESTEDLREKIDRLAGLSHLGGRLPKQGLVSCKKDWLHSMSGKIRKLKQTKGTLCLLQPDLFWFGPCLLCW
jgi:hypothetical protein